MRISIRVCLAAMVAPAALAGAQVKATTIQAISHIPVAAPKELETGPCKPEGTASSPSTFDPATNLLKNRIDPGDYVATTISTINKLPWMSIDDPSNHMKTRRKDWTPAELTRTEKYESRPVYVDAYVIAIHHEGKEETNCSRPDSAWLDWHMWLVATEPEASNKDKTRAVVAEVTPRVRAGHVGDFDRAQIAKWAHDGVKVRVSGWLLLDPDHPTDALGSDKKSKSRGTIWEIHPVMSIKPAP